ncbi:MAG TPA: ribonuclease HII [Candidatus Sulfopaludibacter sp.]|nr:ribonuclease HII [Candidatus Sulfopaludibacter sp.]
MFLGGIDEAGRGSVVGPLVIAGISFNSKNINALKNMAITDSKKTLPWKRKEIFEEILKLCESIFICKINCSTIDKFVKLNGLNKLESKFMTIVADNLIANKIIVDSCDVNPFRFQQEIKKNLTNKNISIYSYHKADLDNIIVSCASIIAKVTRDNEIAKIKETLGKDIGSGYPSDPKTKTFIKNEIEIENSKKYIRFSWKPVKQIINKNLQTTLFC